MAQREGVKLSRAELQSDPALNVRLGVRYLKYLKEMFGGRLDFILMVKNGVLNFGNGRRLNGLLSSHGDLRLRV